jgi:hypothetical protein
VKRLPSNNGTGPEEDQTIWEKDKLRQQVDLIDMNSFHGLKSIALRSRKLQWERTIWFCRHSNLSKHYIQLASSAGNYSCFPNPKYIPTFQPENNWIYSTLSIHIESLAEQKETVRAWQLVNLWAGRGRRGKETKGVIYIYNFLAFSPLSARTH